MRQDGLGDFAAKLATEKGVVQEMGVAPDPLTLEFLRRNCEEREHILRLQFQPIDPKTKEMDYDAEASTMPRKWDRELKNPRYSTETMTGCLRRYALLSRLHWLWSNGMNLSGPKEQADAMRKLLEREPVHVDIGTRIVSVTSRSYASMVELAKTWARIQFIETEILQANLIDARTTKRAIRKKIARLVGRLYDELAVQRRWLYAHAFTDDGSPAGSIDEAPAWWAEIDPVADARILAGLFEAGPVRYQTLGPAPRGRESKAVKREDFGYQSLLAAVDKDMNVEPGTFANRDFYQTLAWLRASAPPELPERGS